MKSLLEEFYCCTRIPIQLYNDVQNIVEYYPSKDASLEHLAIITDGINEFYNLNTDRHVVFGEHIIGDTTIKINYYITYIQPSMREIGIIVLGPCYVDRIDTLDVKDLRYLPEIAAIHAFELFRSLFLHHNTSSVPIYETSNYPVNRFLNYINLNYGKNLSLHSVANKLNLNHHYLCRIIKKETGKTGSQILSEVRINRAKLLLHDKNLSLLEIAHMIGYTDQSYFSKQFHKYAGISPLRYRKNFINT